MKPVSVSALTRICYLGMFVFGTVFTILGAILPLLLQTRNVNVAQAGSLFFFLNLCSLAAVLIAGAVVDRTGYKATLILAPLLIGISFLLLEAARSYPDLVVAACVMGLGGGALNNATNSFISDLHPADRTIALNRLGMFFSVGALFIPLLMGSLLMLLGIRGIIFIAAAIAASPSVLLVFLTVPAPKQIERVPLGMMVRTLANPFVLLMGVLLFFQSGSEFSAGGWISSFFTTARGLGNREASWILALFWASVMVSRLLVHAWIKRSSEIQFVFLCAFAAALSWLLLLYSRVLAVEIAAVVLLGYALAGIFPTCLSIAGARFPASSGAVFGALLAVATIGGMTVPSAVGQIALNKGIVRGMSILPFCSASVCILARFVGRASRRSP
jgi:fucose permease